MRISLQGHPEFWDAFIAHCEVARAGKPSQFTVDRKLDPACSAEEIIFTFLPSEQYAFAIIVLPEGEGPEAWLEFSEREAALSDDGA